MLLRLQRTYRRVKPDESPAFIHHLLLHQCIIIQQRTHMGWRLNWGQDFLVPAQTWAPALWFLPAEDFASPLLSDVWCQTSHEAYPAFSPQEWYFFSSLIAEYLRLGSLKKLNILRLLQLCQIRVKSANSFRCHGQSLRHTETEENPSKTAPPDILFFNTWDLCLQSNLLSEMQPQGKFPVNSAEPEFHPITNPSPFHNEFTLLSCSVPFPFWSLHCYKSYCRFFQGKTSSHAEANKE